METTLWIMAVMVAFAAGMFFGCFVLGSAVRIVETKFGLSWECGDEDDNSEAWKKR